VLRTILACATDDFTVSHETNSLPGNKMYVARLKKFSLQKPINEIIIQYLTGATVVCNEPFVVGMSMLSDVMSKSEIVQGRWWFSVNK
jgi:hypothetical protein